MGQILHGSATTTEAVRRAIQHRQESLRGLAKRYGVNPKTVAKWKARILHSDLPTGPERPRSTVLSAEEEAIVVAFRRHTLSARRLPIRPAAEAVPHLTRSSLHRCLQHHEISRLRKSKAKPPPNANSRPIRSATSYRHRRGSNCARQALPTRRRRPTSKFAFMMHREGGASHRGGDFLRRLIAAVPYQGPMLLLTDNGTHFTTPGNTSSAAPDIKAALEAGELVWAHAFEYACAQNDIDHRLTKPIHGPMGRSKE